MLAVLDSLETGGRLKRIAADQGVCVKTLIVRLQRERERRGAKTTHQLVAEHVKAKLRG